MISAHPRSKLGRRRGTRGAAAPILGCAVMLASLWVAFAADPVETASAQSTSPKVLVSTTGHDSEMRKKVPITRKAGRRSRVVMSMGPNRFPDLRAGDRLQVLAEVEVTTDCVERMPRCVGRPYSYNPIVETRLILADGRRVKGGEGSLELGARRQRCRQKPPSREHHCVIVFPSTILDVADQTQLPCAPGSCYLNLVIDSHNKRKEKGKKGRRNKLLVGEDEPDGSIVQDKGRISAVRLSPGDQPGVPPLVTTTAFAPSVEVRKGERHVIYSQQLNGLEKGDQLAVNARMPVDISQLSYNVLIKSRLILALGPTDTGPGKKVKRLTDPTGEITEGNGYNCTQRRPQCVTTKGGVITMTKDARDSGSPIPLYVNLVAQTAKPGAKAPSGDSVQILSGGHLGVTRYPASLKG